jgi:hypothetical protein
MGGSVFSKKLSASEKFWWSKKLRRKYDPPGIGHAPSASCLDYFQADAHVKHDGGIIDAQLWVT